MERSSFHRIPKWDLYDFSDPIEEVGRKKKRKIKLKPKKILILAAVVCVLFNVLQLHYTIWSLNKQIEEGIEVKKELLAEQKKLKEEIEKVKSPEYVEKLAREQLGLVKPGESLVITKTEKNN
ncbi:MAG: Septum formation initiator [Clostridia bacterium 41_269]|nr:MAG: Septum formation initiator [Clostridia bacterium 41_269]